jgi:hypothetical protein
MLAPLTMLRGTLLPALALPSAMLLGAAPARAQTAASAASVSASGQAFPERFVNGVDLGASTRPQNLTPLGISYADCISDMTLSFNVVVSGFDGSQNLQVWASKSGDCTAITDRGGTGAVAATCWLVNPGFTAQIHTTPTTLNFAVRVQDLVGAQNAPPFPANYVAQGPSACGAQSTFAAVPLTINFVPIDSSGNYDGTAFQFSQPTDLVGPPAPAGATTLVGDTLLFANWSLNTDSDTSGYDVFIDPIPGHEGSLAAPIGATALICPDTGAPTTQDDAAADAGDDATDSGDDGSTPDMAVDSGAVDSGCYLINVGGSTAGSGICTSAVLASGMVQDSGTVQEVDDAGNLISSGAGGISTIPPQNLVGNGSAGVTVPDRSTGSFTITGLVNNVTYNVAVAAVDGFGNVGPPSPETCSKPEPVDDFWKIYRQDGGGAGGGFCSLETLGARVPSAAGLFLFGGTAVLVVRRRTARRRSRRSAAHSPRSSR